MGSLNREEKHWTGRLLHDIGSVAADISLFGLPALLYVVIAVDSRVVWTGLLAWAVVIGVAALLRGGWVRPLGSTALGWVALRVSLVPARLVCYNLVLLVAVYGGLMATDLLGWPAGVVAVSCLGTVGTLTIPTVADRSYELVAG